MRSFTKKRHAGRMVVGTLLFLIGLTCLGIVLWLLVKDLSLWILGRGVTAEVIDLWYQETDEQGSDELNFDYFIAYRFTASNGQIITRTARIGGLEWSGFTRSSPVQAIYFPPYPAHNRLDDSRFVPLLACAYLPLLFVGLSALGGGRYLIQTASHGPRQKPGKRPSEFS